MFAKPPKLSEQLHESQLEYVRNRPAYPLRGDGGAVFFVATRSDPHHLRQVWSAQRRRSNPILVPLSRADHDWLHDHPQVEEERRAELLLEALRHLVRDDVELAEAATRVVLELMAQRED